MPDHPRVSPYRLERRDDGRWEVRWFVKPPRKNQEQRRRLPKVKDQRDLEQCEAWLLRWGGPESEEEVGGDVLTIERAVDEYLTHHARPKGQERSAANNLKAIVRMFGNSAAETFSEEDVQIYTARRLRDVKPSTVRRELAALQAALNWAMRKVLKSPRVFLFEKPPDGPPRDRWINEEQEQEIRAQTHAAPLDVRIFFDLAITYAVRRGAMLDLTFGSQVDFMGGYIDFNVPGAPKTNKRRPRVPMLDHIRELLALRLQEVGGGKVLDGFATVKRYEAFMAEIGYEWVTPHVLKHSAITLMIRGGASIEQVAKNTETSLNTIMTHYRHHSRDEAVSVFSSRAR